MRKKNVKGKHDFWAEKDVKSMILVAVLSETRRKLFMLHLHFSRNNFFHSFKLSQTMPGRGSEREREHQNYIIKLCKLVILSFLLASFCCLKDKKPVENCELRNKMLFVSSSVFTFYFYHRRSSWYLKLNVCTQMAMNALGGWKTLSSLFLSFLIKQIAWIFHIRLK